MVNHSDINKQIREFDPRSQYSSEGNWLPQSSWLDLLFYGFIRHRDDLLMPYSVRRKEKRQQYRSMGKEMTKPGMSYWIRLSEAADALHDLPEGDGMTRLEVKELALRRLGLVKARLPSRINGKIVFGSFVRFVVPPPWWRRVCQLASPNAVVNELAAFYGAPDKDRVHRLVAPYFHCSAADLDFSDFYRLPDVVLRYPPPHRSKIIVAG